MKALLGSSIALSLALAIGATPAYALTPQRFAGGGVERGVIHCGSFDDNFVDRFSFSATAFSDRSGTVQRISFQFENASSDVNSVTGFTVHEFDRSHRVLDLVNGTYTIDGAYTRAKERGLGLVLQGIGRLVFNLSNFQNVFTAGHTPSDADYCRALS